ncbi:hypothetical protein LAZ40_09370 [Cereibacter sphaeroides]|uniref:hypothetical protein n=1 Tax=Cereibacter sphaeroides TaxID=1063 RepID=UPI001F1F03D5|nr:hypothetical protein [Cereibacter sphaeroides]MCE6959261.1 hypothetical protein [Cereibacter sphaeroides]MCE6971255.1 hypothetical protein [Cereibacter sphaeroides]
MPNLITNAVIVSGSDEVILRAIAAFISADAAKVLQDARASKWQQGYGAFTPEHLVPEPAVIGATRDDASVDIGLAVLSAGGEVLGQIAPDLAAQAGGITDWLRVKQDRDPFLSAMPAEYQTTTPALLRKLGLDDVDPAQLRAAAEAKAPGAVAAGVAAIRAWLETGEFGWYDWRQKHWGARAFGEALTVSLREDDSVALRFDSVNSAPGPLLRAFAQAHPDIAFEAASVDEDNDFSAFFVTDPDEPEGLLEMEENDEDGVRRAREIVYGPADPDEDLGEDPDDDLDPEA